MILRISLYVLCVFTLNAVFSQSHFLTLNGQKMDLPKNAYQITEVIDERVSQSNSGWTQLGMMNRKVQADFSKPFQQEIMFFLIPNLQSSGPKLKLVVRTLSISEKTGAFSEFGFCNLAVDFILETESSQYLVLKSSITTEVKGADVTKKHPENIASAFQYCFEQLASIDLTNLDQFLAIDPTKELDESIPDSVKYNFPLFNGPVKTGIYASYYELRNNTPNQEEFSIERYTRTNEPWTGTENVVPRLNDSEIKTKEIWAFAWQGQVYMAHQKEFFPLTIKDYQLYFTGYGIPSNESVSTGALVGGLIGAGIAAGVEKSKAKKQKIKYSLDPFTGNIQKTELQEEAQ